MAEFAVLSVFETASTRTGGMFGSKVMLVNERFARTNTQLEQMLPSKSDHASICCVAGGSAESTAISSFIETAVKKIRDTWKRRSQEDFNPIGLGESTVRSKSSTGSLKQAEKITSKDGSSSGPRHFSVYTSPKGTTGSTIGSLHLLPALTDFSIDKMDTKLPCFVMPLSRNSVFSGQGQLLKDLAKYLSPMNDNDSELSEAGSGTHPRTFALCGPGGMGKSQVAAEFVYRSRDKFDAIIWISADDPTKVSRSFGLAAVALGLVEAESLESRDHILTRDAVLGWLANPVISYKQLGHTQSKNEATWLLVFDNVEDTDMLDDYLPVYASGSILITSRDPLVKSNIYSHRDGLTMPPFDAEQNNATAVAEILGGLPLAIVQMAGVITRQNLTFSEFLSRFQDQSTHASLFSLKLGPSKARAGYEHTIASVWALEQLGEGSQVLLQAMSLLDPDSIPEYILEENPAAGTWPDYPSTSTEYHNARTELMQRSLITRNKEQKTLTIHRLIQDAVRARMTDYEFSKAFSSVLSFLSAVWPYEKFSFGSEVYRWARCQELFSHILKLQNLFSRFKVPTKLTQNHLDGPKLFIDAASNTNMWGRFDDTIPLLFLAELLCDALGDENQDASSPQDLIDQLAICRRTIIYERGVQALHTNNPQISLLNMKKFGELVRDSYKEKPSGGTDQTVGVSWNELGNAYFQNNDTIEAEKCFLKSKSFFESMEDATSISISMPLINLGFAALAQGRLNEAEMIFSQALTDREKEYGRDDKISFVTGKLLLGYGNVKFAQGKLDDSSLLHQRCLQQYKSTVGNNHRRTADSCVKVASHLVRVENFEPALILLNQAIKIYTAGGHLHFIAELTRARRNRGLLLQSLGRGADAITDLDVARELWQIMCPGDWRKFEDLSDEDFDQKIMFWRRQLINCTILAPINKASLVSGYSDLQWGMPPLSAYTPFESLLFFQCLASLSSRPTNFSAISDTLRKNQFIKDNAAFDTDRLSPQALEELYTTLLQEGVDEPSSAGEKTGHLQDGAGTNPKKRKIASGNVASVGAPQSHTALVPEVVSQLYARYKDRVTKEIRDEEKRYRDISEEIKKLQKDAVEESVATAPQGAKVPEGLTPAQPSNEDMDIDVKDDTKTAEVVASTIAKPPEQHKVDLQSRPAIPIPIHKTTQPLVAPVTTTPIPSLPGHEPSIQGVQKQQLPPPSIPVLPEVVPQQLQSQQMLQQQQQTIKQAPPPLGIQAPPSVTFTPPLKAPVNGKGTPLASQPPASLQASPKVQVKVPPPPQQPQRLPPPPQAAPRVAAPSRGQPTLPAGSTIVFQAQQGTSLPATPTNQRHAQIGERAFSKGTPVPAGSPVTSQLSQAQQPFQQWTAHPIPSSSVPATPNAPSPSGAQPMLNRPTMLKQGNLIPPTDVTGKLIPSAFQSNVPFTPAPLLSATQTPVAQMQQQPQTTPFTGTPSISVDVKIRPPRPSMDTAGSLTPWKRTPTLHINIPETPGSPSRPKPEDVSPISETASSPIEPAESLLKETMPRDNRGQPETERPRSGRKPSVAPSGAETVVSKSDKSTAVLGNKRAGSTTSTRSRARSIASRDEESATDTAVTTQRKIKHEAPSTPAGVLEDVDVETRAGTRRKAVAATSLAEEAPVKSRAKRKRGASEALEVDTAHPTPTRAISSQFVYCTRNFTRTGAPIMNDVAAHKHASIFAKPLTEREAPGYKDLIYRPQDLKSIKSALTHGNKAIAAATEAVNTAAEGESPNPAATGTPSKNTAWLAKTPELIPPKAIVNSSQLEKELIRMFANAVMFNPAPERERGFGGAFRMRKPNEPRPSSHPWELDEGGIIRDTREMCDDVEKAVTKWRAAERTTTTDDSASKSMLSLRGSSGDSNTDGTDADNKG
ncbi:hypothetical protein UA08_02958 [Talaromyces atroroseus]|uniref:Bromo domain-containing protein n=1 Tax=Talaromyces atroroseus TaxID=1441469 RepID=A0A225AMF2_TALAT|nr:hypothetical protein UA08_02958 [Talaromyces atroroseus]OKL62070.1 hypothetical protein UA08_02958 [Talaromyces atroroseus]